MERFGPLDPWPAHQKSFGRELYTEARGRGWSLTTMSAHTGASKLVCPGGACVVRVSGTPKDPDREAKSGKKRIRCCPHGAAADPLLAAAELLDKAEILLDALDRIRDAQIVEARAGQLVGGVEDESALEEIVDELEVLEREIAELLQDREPPTPEELLAEATDTLAEARHALAPVVPGHELRSLRDRLRKLRQRCDAHRKNLATSQATRCAHQASTR